MVEKKIAILINCRVEGNSNCGLKTLLKSVLENSSCPKQIEVLVKFDTNDSKALDLAQEIATHPLVTKILFEPQGRGYIDIHIGYNRLLQFISPSTQLIGAMGDDFVVDKDWDAVLLSHAAMAQGKYFIIHQRPHPPTERSDYHTQPFKMDYQVFDIMESLFIVDEAPFWSRKLIFATTWLGGGLSFTDGWTIALEYALWHLYRLNITLFLDSPMIHRLLGPNDGVDAKRWSTERATNFEYVRSNYFREIVGHQARNIALNLEADYGEARGLEMSHLQPSSRLQLLRKETMQEALGD